MLPNFLGIGVPRGGTTWLHELLTTHPEIYMPVQRKEIHYFDRYPDRDLSWYESFFPSDTDAKNYKAIGEISPEYLFYSECLDRISKVKSIDKFILMLRNPVNRAYSYYGLKVRNTNYKGTFEEFIEEYPATTRRGNYTNYISDFLDYFDREQLLILITEKSVSNVPDTKDVISEFLNVSPALFPENAGLKRVNKSYVTRAPSIYALMVKTSVKFRKWDGLTDLARKMGVKQLFRSEKSLPTMKPETREYLEQYYDDEIHNLELLLDTNLDCWWSRK